MHSYTRAAWGLREDWLGHLPGKREVRPRSVWIGGSDPVTEWNCLGAFKNPDTQTTS